MKELLLVIGSVVICVAADILIDYYYLKKHKIGSEDYNNSLTFARNNKSVVDKRDNIESILNKLSEMEGQLNYLSKQSSAASPDLSEMKRDLSLLKIELRKALNNDSDHENSIQNIVNELRKISSRIAFLERQSEDGTVSYSANMSDYEQKIRLLENEVKRMNTIINEQRQQLERNDSVINNLNKEIIELKSYVSSQLKSKEPSYKEQSALQHREIPLNAPKQPSKTMPKAITASRVVVPDEAYVSKLLANLINLEGILGDYEFSCSKKGLQNILDNGDFDDGEEIMESVHSLIKKYIYGSDSKVSQSEWIKLERFIKDAGYEAVEVKPGDDILPYRTYFDRAIAAEGGTPNTVKQVQLHPYIVAYDDGGTRETLKLCGKCTYYK